MSRKNAFRIMTVAIALMGAMVLPGIASAQVAIGISVGFAPPEIPVYEQPICPGEGYLWTPGYWGWDDDDQDYYWVPGTWVLAPEPGYLWTPGYWGWGGGGFFFNEGYWGPQIGFYGGINYGFGYFGHGYEGGRWDGNRFYYNTTVNNVNTTIIHNTYNTTIVNRNETRVSYNGGNGGINVRPTSQEQAAASERHLGPVGAQQQHVQAARGNPELRASANHGRPPIAATSRPGAFSGGGVVAAKSGGNYNPPANRGPRNNERTNAERNNPAANNPNRPPNATNRTENNANRPPNAGNRAETYSHSRDVPQHSVPQADTNANQKYQQQQEKLIQKQNQEHQKLQQKQEQEHQRATQQQMPAPRQQQMEQRHQQQTQQMEQRHTQQQQRVQQRQAPPPRQSESKPHKP